MRLLHTSDWHLGQHFMGKSRQAEHQALIVWLLEQVEAQAVDAVLVAGDIFDTGTPPSYARELYNQLVGQLYKAGVPLLLLGGNHDSVATLGESRELLAHLGTTVIAATHADPATQVVVLSQRNGEPGCIVCAIPFVRPRDVLQSQAGQSAEDKQLSLQTAIQEHYGAVFAAAVERQSALAAELGPNFGRPLPIVATGHLTTVGASTSESVREIYVGALYIALGHIHRPQKVGGLEHIRYCGSPIPLGFDEAKQTKEMLLVDLDSDGLKAVSVLPVPRFQALVAVSGNLQTLAGAIGAAAAQGTRECPAWLEITVAEDDYLADLPARIEALTAGWPVEVLRIRRQRGNTVASLAAEARETLDELSPHDVFARRLQQEELSEEMQSALSKRFRAVIASVVERE
ncbi:MAG: exonuclease subunit SbcD [Betaproteobacteria bacterium HGW-Betaproteobacteria-6]|nr:MAG: exonuclease subunit SbcD [Betaproteobacteria bacterium HGW-Betaproteobacteria-6]